MYISGDAFMNKILIIILSISTWLLSANVHAAFIDFEDRNMVGDGLLNEGDIVTGLNLFGATFTVIGQGNTGGNPRDLMIFDSNCSGAGCSGGDPDLSTTSTINANNILIISEDNDSADPDDSAAGGTIVIKFDTDVTSITGTTVDIGDSDNGPNFFQAFLDGAPVETMNLALMQGDNNIQSRTFTGLFDEIRLSLAGSGALASLEFTPVPLPAALPLFMAGLLGLFGMRRRASI